MKKIIFTDFDIVYYYDPRYTDNFNERSAETNEYFDILDKDIRRYPKCVYIDYDEITNRFIYYYEWPSGTIKYELVPTKKQMEEFKNNKNTLFNNRIRKSLKLSEDNRRYSRIETSGVFKGPEDALFYVEFLKNRTNINDPRIKGSIKYIMENANEDFDKYINYFNYALEELKKDKVSNKKSLKRTYIFLGGGSLLFAILSIFCIVLMFTIDMILLIPTLVPLFLFAALYDSMKEKIAESKNIDETDNKMISDLEEAKEKFKEKELKKTNTIQEEIKDNSYEKKIEDFKRKLINIFYNSEFNLFAEENNADNLRVAILLKEYELEMNMFNEQTLTKAKEKEIQNKYINKANELKDEILSRSYPQKSISEMNIDEVQALLSPKPENGYSRSLRQ